MTFDPIERDAQFLAVCSRSKRSRHLTKSPFLALLATAGSKAAYKIISACSNAVRGRKLCRNRVECDNLRLRALHGDAPVERGSRLIQKILNTYECYEYVVMSRKNVCQTRLPPTLRHKERFAYERPRTPPAVAAPGAPALLGHCRSVETDGDGSEAP